MSTTQPNRHDLTSRAFRQQRRALQGPDPRGFIRSMAFDYLCIAIAIAAVVISAPLLNQWQLGAVVLAAWLVIAARQHALLVLMHDATHFLASGDHQRNDWLGEIFTAAPMLVSLRTYRRDHLAHHQHTNTANDPDWIRKLNSTDEAQYWQFPVRGNWLGYVLRTWARSVLYLLRSFKHLSGGGKKTNTAAAAQAAPQDNLRLWRYGLFAVVALSLTLTGGWMWFVLLWVAPILLVLPMIMRLRSIAEHFALPYFKEFNGSRTVRAGAFERFLFAPHNVGYHLDHHLVASVPHRALPQLHAALLQEPAYRAHAHLNDGYLLGRQSLRKDMVRGPAAAVQSGLLAAQPPS